MAIIFRIVEHLCRLIGEYQLALWRVLMLFDSSKRHVLPLSVLLILHLRCHLILSSLYTYASCSVNKEDVA